MVATMNRSDELLRVGLEALRTRYDARFLATDPLAFVRRFASSDDREVVGLVASSLAYGNVKTIAASLERCLTWMGPRPAEFARRTATREAVRSLGRFRHRWTTARDVACLVHFAGQMLDSHGSIGHFFSESYVPKDMASSLSRFATRALALDHGGLYRARALPANAGVRFFFTNPATGACKRLNMYLRWMVRPDDGLDLGIWPQVPTRDLVVPLDTHIYRIGRHLGWSQRRTPGFRTALDITARLARVEPDDPVKYDFALSRMGILENCPRHRAPRRHERGRCELCELKRRLR
jgi:uncharacterized protein (TIGR02757 family)